MDLAPLRRRHPWPAARPDVPPADHGWFQDGSIRLLRRRITPDTRLIVELGSWAGQSTRWLLDNAPAAVVVAVDHWKGGSDHLTSADPAVVRLLPVLFETFCVNLWDYRDRLVPVRADTLAGLAEVAEHGLAPDLVFIDADHATPAVLADIHLARGLFPRAAIVGDDWRWPSVATAVRQAAAHHEMSIVIDANAWALEPL